MLRANSRPPVDYSLCNQTVTIYHQTGAGKDFSCSRIVFKGAFFDCRKNETVNKTGSRETNPFLLILPSKWGGRKAWAYPSDYAGKGFTLAPNDKVILGIGPEIESRNDWAAFIPAKHENLVVIKDVDVKYWKNSVTHVEAGG